jgi:hypothetical protein
MKIKRNFKFFSYYDQEEISARNSRGDRQNPSM